MATMNAFMGSAFNSISLTGVVDNVDYQPSFLGSMNLFEPVPVRTRDIFVDRRDGQLALIPTSADLAPPTEDQPDPRDAISLRTTRLAKSFTLTAVEIAAIRGFGQESELEAAQSEFLRRMGRLRQDMALTYENHMLGGIQGIVLDADGSTVINNYFTDFAEAQAASINFGLGTNTTDVRGVCSNVIREMARSSRGAFLPSTEVHALVGDTFFDQLRNHDRVRDTYLSHAAASDLRKSNAFESFSYGGIMFHNYRGTDDQSAVNVAANEAIFFPKGARDFFKKAMAPHETFEYVNTSGLEMYAERKYERDNNPAESRYVKGELYSYPLFICQQPRALRRAVAS